ncbi:MAG: hypothetical protein H0T42_07870 [Deltaproteobacteria bacterium]|nr:hypothetical protein [Deltaproteobacteria bacterium]
MLVLRAAGKAMTLGELAMQLQVGRDVLRRVAGEVAASGVVELIDGDALQLKSGTWEAEIAEAADLYETEPKTLIKVLSRISMERIRSLAARTFADAFRIRRKDGD